LLTIIVKTQTHTKAHNKIEGKMILKITILSPRLEKILPIRLLYYNLIL